MEKEIYREVYQISNHVFIGTIILNFMDSFILLSFNIDLLI
jgi:hypothetical protein